MDVRINSEVTCGSTANGAKPSRFPRNLGKTYTEEAIPIRSC